MVNRLLIVCIFMFCIVTPAHAQDARLEDKLTVQVSQTEKQFGQYFRVTVNYTGNQSLEHLSLDLWKQYFSIVYGDEYKDEDEYGRIIQTLKLRLYPRNQDVSQLPALTLEKAKSLSIPLKVTPTKIKNEPIELSWNVSNLSPWQREAVIIHVRIQSSDATAHVILDSPDNNESMLRTLKTKKHIAKNGIAIFDAGWIFYPLSDGKQSIDLPAIRYQLSGSDRRRFYLPIQNLQVNPLPSYLPPNLPVGELKLNTYIESGEINEWKTIVHTPALIPFGVPGLDKQLSIINGQDISNIKMKYKKLSDYKNYGDLNIIDTPLPKWLMPIGPDINVKLRYFDPQSGTLKESLHNLPRHWTMPVWAWWITLIICGFLSLIVFKQIRPWLIHLIVRWNTRKQLKTEMTANQLRKLLLNNRQYISLNDWAKENHNRKTLAAELNNACFANTTSFNSSNLQSDILKAI